MRLICVLFFSFALVTTCQASEWTDRDIALQAAAVGLLLGDMETTTGIYNNPGHRESNPLLGANPRPDAVNAYFAACILGHTLLADRLSGWKRTAFQLSVIALEAWCVHNNISKGLDPGGAFVVSYSWAF